MVSYLEVWWLHPRHELVHEAAGVLALNARPGVAEVVDDVLDKEDEGQSRESRIRSDQSDLQKINIFA